MSAANTRTFYFTARHTSRGNSETKLESIYLFIHFPPFFLFPLFPLPPPLTAHLSLAHSEPRNVYSSTVTRAYTLLYRMALPRRLLQGTSYTLLSRVSKQCHTTEQSVRESKERRESSALLLLLLYYCCCFTAAAALLQRDERASDAFCKVRPKAKLMKLENNKLKGLEKLTLYSCRPCCFLLLPPSPLLCGRGRRRRQPTAKAALVFSSSSSSKASAVVKQQQ
jgi:hypothetical protein